VKEYLKVKRISRSCHHLENELMTCRSHASGNPETLILWIPAFAGMTKWTVF